jgi:hypothetical protein
MKVPYLLCVGMLAAATATVNIQAQNPPALAGSTLPAGMFSTLGIQIVDQNQNPVRLACVYWQGMNGDDGTLSNLTTPLNGYQANVNAIAAVGFNCIRVDINNIWLHDSGTALFLNMLDMVVAAVGSAGLRIIIVDHDNEGNFGTNDNFSNDCAAQ